MGAHKGTNNSPESKILKKVREEHPDRHPGGSPAKYTEEILNQIVEAIRHGNYYETAAAYAGIDSDTLRRWMKWGRQGRDQMLIDFLEKVKQAKAEAEVRDLRYIGLAAEKNWFAAAWRLERRYPNRWGRQRLEITGNITLRPGKRLDPKEREQIAENYRAMHPELFNGKKLIASEN